MLDAKIASAEGPRLPVDGAPTVLPSSSPPSRSTAPALELLAFGASLVVCPLRETTDEALGSPCVVRQPVLLSLGSLTAPTTRMTVHAQRSSCHCPPKKKNG